MRYPASEKLEIIRTVEKSHLPAKQTLDMLGIPKTTFYRWYDRFLAFGDAGLEDRNSSPGRVWNRIPDDVRGQIIDLALEETQLSPRELAVRFTDTRGYFVSEASVYRLLKAHDLITSPAFVVIKAADEFRDKTTAPNQLWQTDFTYLKVIGWGWFYLSTVLDDYSRYIIAWKLCTNMTADDVTATLKLALEASGCNRANVVHKPRLLSDNGSSYISGDLAEWLEDHGMDHVRGAPYHPQTQGKIERWHQTLKNRILLENYYLPGDLENQISAFYHRAECLTHVGDSQAVRSLTQCGEPMRFAMAAPIDLRNDFDSVSLRRLAKRTRDATQSRRLLALAEVYDGGSRTDASRIGGVGLQIIRDWVLRFNARGPDGLVDGKSPGAPSKLNADHRRALAEVVEAGPVPAVDGVVRWRRKDLARWLLETFAISLDETTVGRELKALGFAKISARPRHYAQNELAVEAFKKNFPAELAKIRARLPKGVEIELWWQDEARIGQKNKLTRRWARRGTRPRAPRDQRTEWAYIFGAICPAKGKGAGLVMPWCDTDAMAAHLIEISAAVDPGAHAVLIVDQAGWHLTPKLAIPDNITVLALPPRSPELNPVENVWQFMRDNWLSNRIFKSYEDIVALCCQAWNNLIDQPWKIMSLGMRKWAHGF